jgi:hypothetical protein
VNPIVVAGNGFQQDSPKPSSRVQALAKPKVHYGICAPTDGSARMPRCVFFWMKPEQRDERQDHW